MTYGVQILATSEIRLPQPPSSSPCRIKLSLLDTYWMICPPVEKLILYSNPTTTPIPSSHLLKSSLSSTLIHFLPLAGKLVHVPTTGDVQIDLSTPSFTFVEAESDLDLHKLATDEAHDVASFIKLVPTIDVTVLPIQAFAVQVTRFRCGGAAIGYSVHHAVVDGKGMMQFIQAWAATCRSKMLHIDASVGTSFQACRLSFDRSVVIRHPNGEELARKFLKVVAPHLPKTAVPSVSSLEADRLRYNRRTFVLDVPSIQLLKGRATSLAVSSRPPSTFSVITAYTWACYARAKSFDPSDRVGMIIPMDCRARLNPPIQEDFFANCLCPVFPNITVSKLIGDDGLTLACDTMSKAISEASKDPLHNCEIWFGNQSKEQSPDSDTLFDGMFPFDKFVNVTASPRFRVYELDFGWGKPARFEAVSMNRDGEFALVSGKEEGMVQVSIVVDPKQMETFASIFLSGLSQ